MSRKYTDKELMIATQIAYCNFAKDIISQTIIDTDI